MKRTRLKVIALDFDGTLVESNNIKDRAFETIFSEWPEHTESIFQWHLAHDAIERREKFRYFVEEVLGLSDRNDLIENLTSRFGQLTKTAIIECAFVKGAEEFLEFTRNKVAVYLISTTPQFELNKIIEERKLGKFFKRVFGAPFKKIETLQNIMLLERVSIKEILFIGDSPQDQQSAKYLSIGFIGRQSDRKLVDNYGNIFTDFIGMKHYIKIKYELYR